MEVRQPGRLAEALSTVLAMDREEILTRIEAGRRRPFEPVPLRRDVGKAVVLSIEENRLRAVRLLEPQIGLPSEEPVTRAWLRVAPAWRPLRGHPAFERLLQQP